jgi:hypothetical protein
MTLVKEFVGDLKAGLRSHHRFWWKYGADDHNLHALLRGAGIRIYTLLRMACHLADGRPTARSHRISAGA